MRMTAEIVGKSGRRRGRQRDEDEEERGKNIFLKNETLQLVRSRVLA